MNINGLMGECQDPGDLLVQFGHLALAPFAHEPNGTGDLIQEIHLGNSGGRHQLGIRTKISGH